MTVQPMVVKALPAKLQIRVTICPGVVERFQPGRKKPADQPTILRATQLSQPTVGIMINKGRKTNRRGRGREEENEWPHPLWSEAVTPLPPPTQGSSTGHTHWGCQNVPVPVHKALLCLFVPTPVKPGSGSCSPHAARSQQLSLLDYWQQRCGAISSLSHHRGKDHSHTHRLLSLSPTPLCCVSSRLSPACSSHSLTHGAGVVVLVWVGLCVCVCVCLCVCVCGGAGFRCTESSLQNRRWLFLMLQRRRSTGS